MFQLSFANAFFFTSQSKQYSNIRYLQTKGLHQTMRALIVTTIAILRQESLCFDSSKHYDGRQSTISIRIKHPVGRQSALFNRSMTNLAQEWLCYNRRKYPVARQSVFSLRKKHRDGRQKTLFYRTMTNHCQELLCYYRKKHSVGCQSALFNRTKTNLVHEWSYY